MQSIISRFDQPVADKQLHSAIPPPQPRENNSDNEEFRLKMGMALRDIAEKLVEKNEYEVAMLIFTGLVQNVPQSVHNFIFRAANAGDIFSMNMLLIKGEDADKEDVNGWTSLHY